MQCFDCGRRGEKLYEFGDGRKTVYLCRMCKAEREWIRNPPPVIPSTTKELPKEERTFWDKLSRFFKGKGWK